MQLPAAHVVFLVLHGVFPSQVSEIYTAVKKEFHKFMK